MYDTDPAQRLSLDYLDRDMFDVWTTATNRCTLWPSVMASGGHDQRRGGRD